MVDSRIKPWIVCASHAWGGLEQVALRDAELLVGQRMKPRLVVAPGTPIEERAKKNPALDVEVLPQFPRNYFDFGLRASLQKSIEEGFSIVHLHQSSLLGSVIPWIGKKQALVLSKHLLSDHKKKSLYHRFVYSRVSRVLAISEAMKKNILKTHPVSAEKVRVLSLGIDLAKFNPARFKKSESRKKFSLPESQFLFGVLGRLDPAKGQWRALRALAHPSMKDAGLVLVGEETRGQEGELSVLKNLAKELGVWERVYFTGFIPDPAEALSSLDVLLMPSDEEAFGLVALEGMAMGIPVVVSSTGSGAEIVGKEEWGFSADPLKIEEWRLKMDFTKQNQEVSKKKALLAQIHVQERFDEKVRIRKTLETYSEILFDKASLGLYT